MGTLGKVASMLAATLYQGNADFLGTTSSGISYQLRYIYSICRCCWNVATCKWKVHNGKIEIISFVVEFRFLTAPDCSLRSHYLLCMHFKVPTKFKQQEITCFALRDF